MLMDFKTQIKRTWLHAKQHDLHSRFSQGPWQSQHKSITRYADQNKAATKQVRVKSSNSLKKQDQTQKPEVPVKDPSSA